MHRVGPYTGAACTLQTPVWHTTWRASRVVSNGRQTARGPTECLTNDAWTTHVRTFRVGLFFPAFSASRPRPPDVNVSGGHACTSDDSIRPGGVRFRSTRVAAVPALDEIQFRVKNYRLRVKNKKNTDVATGSRRRQRKKIKTVSFARAVDDDGIQRFPTCGTREAHEWCPKKHTSFKFGKSERIIIDIKHYLVYSIFADYIIYIYRWCGGRL